MAGAPRDRRCSMCTVGREIDGCQWLPAVDFTPCRCAARLGSRLEWIIRHPDVPLVEARTRSGDFTRDRTRRHPHTVLASRRPGRGRRHDPADVRRARGAFGERGPGTGFRRPGPGVHHPGRADGPHGHVVRTPVLHQDAGVGEGRGRLAARRPPERCTSRVPVHDRGARGFAPEGRRRQGTDTSPTGVFTIKVTFSTTRPTPGDAVEAPEADFGGAQLQQPPLQHVDRGARRTDGDRASMRYGFWVGYNNPRLKVDVGPAPVRGLGSGIFYHTSPIGEKWTTDARAAPRSASPRRCAGSCGWLNRPPAARRQQHLS